jgi:hypothetical protein
MRKTFLYLLTAFNLFHSCSEETTEFKINLSFIDPDSAGYYFMGFGAQRGFKNKEFLFKEKINKYPDNLNLVSNYFVCFQPRQFYMNKAQESEESKKMVLDMLRVDNLKELKTNYSETYADCIASIGLFKDNQNKKFVIMDQNNDEDYSNDPVLEFFQHEVKHGPRGINFNLESVQSNVTSQIFDGKEIINKTYPLRFSKLISERHKSNLIFLYSIRSMPVGTWKIGENTFRIGILNKNSQIEYNKHDRLWIDTNFNNIYDENDIAVSINFPFIFQEKVYEVSELDRFGRHITLKKIDKPQIKEGNIAPEIEAMTLDSSLFKLSDFKNKYVLLNFWGTW